MLTYEALIEQAKNRGLPLNKIRGILREYLQILILKEISRANFGQKLYFLGGTYLRLIHNLKRFSEDLDFNAHSMSIKEFNLLINSVKKKLERAGIVSKISFKHRDKLLISNITFFEAEKHYNVIDTLKKSGIMIKVEANCPTYKMETEAHVVSGFGEIFPIICMKKEYIFAEKIDALIKKDRGRHIYDTIFMIANNFPVSQRILRINKITKKADQSILDKINSLSKSELQKQAKILQPFLFDEKESELIINAPMIISELLNKKSIEVIS